MTNINTNYYLFKEFPVIFRTHFFADLIGGTLGPVLGVHHEQHMRESRPEVGTVRMMVPELEILNQNVLT
jgi:hypothetical protein